MELRACTCPGLFLDLFPDFPWIFYDRFLGFFTNFFTMKNRFFTNKNREIWESRVRRPGYLEGSDLGISSETTLESRVRRPAATHLAEQEEREREERGNDRRTPNQRTQD